MQLPEDVNINELTAEYRRLRESALRTQEQLRTATATATSSKGLVTAVVGPHGELQSLTFNSRAYRNMPPAELSHVILDTVRRARDQVMRDLMGALPSTLPGGLTAEDMLRGTIDVSALLPEDVSLDGFSFPVPPPGGDRRGTTSTDERGPGGTGPRVRAGH